MLSVNDIKKCRVIAKVINGVQLQKEDVKSISVVVTLANCETEIDSCASLLIAKNISFSVEGNTITIDFDTNVKSLKCSYFNYIVDCFAFASIDIETDKHPELDDSAVITYICDDAEEVAELSILDNHEAVYVKEED